MDKGRYKSYGRFYDGYVQEKGLGQVVLCTEQTINKKSISGNREIVEGRAGRAEKLKHIQVQDGVHCHQIQRVERDWERRSSHSGLIMADDE